MSKKIIFLALILIVIVIAIILTINKKAVNNSGTDVINIKMEEGKEIIEKSEGVYDIVDINTNELIFQNVTTEEMVIFEQDPSYNPDPNY